MVSRWLTRSLLCMCAMTFLVAMGFSLMVPILPLYVREFGASNIQVGAVVAGFALARTAFNLPAGIVAGRLGSKSSILLGLVFVGVTSVVIGLARNYETVLLARTIAGIGSAFLGVAIGLYRTLSDMGVVTGPLFLTAISENSQPTAKSPVRRFLWEEYSWPPQQSPS